MIKFFALLLCAAMLLSFSACGQVPQDGGRSASASQGSVRSEASASSKPEKPAKPSKPESGQCTFNFTFYNLDEDDDGTQYEEMPCVVEAVYDNGIFTLKTPSAGLLMASETDGEYCITGAGLKVPGAEEDEVVVLFFTLEISANKPK